MLWSSWPQPGSQGTNPTPQSTHITPDQQGTWAPAVSQGWEVGRDSAYRSHNEITFSLNTAIRVLLLKNTFMIHGFNYFFKKQKSLHREENVKAFSKLVNTVNKKPAMIYITEIYIRMYTCVYICMKSICRAF